MNRIDSPTRTITRCESTRESSFVRNAERTTNVGMLFPAESAASTAPVSDDMILRLLPLVLFLGIGFFLWRGLSLDPSELPSPLIGKTAPTFTVATLEREPSKAAGIGVADALRNGNFDSDGMAGEPWLLNVWASWCGPCIQEHPQLVAFERESPVPIVGLNYKDDPAAARAWLVRYGDPFAAVLSDIDGAVGLDYGVYGVPETYLIGPDGRVSWKHVGPIDEKTLREELLPLAISLTTKAESTR